jgi:hypothetical protein
MSYTLDQVRRNTEFAKNALEAGSYVFRVAKVLKKVPEKGYFEGKEVLVFISNPLTDTSNAASYDNSRTVYPESLIPVPPAPGEDGKVSKEAQDEFNKSLRSFAYWAQVFGIVTAAPEKTGDKKADWAAYEEWCVDAANALVDAVDCGSIVGCCFRADIELNEKGYPKLLNKAAV